MKSRLVLILLIISVILNLAIGAIALSLFNFRSKYIFTEEFSVIAMEDISWNFCQAYVREKKGSEIYQKDELYRPFCEKLIELREKND